MSPERPLPTVASPPAALLFTTALGMISERVAAASRDFGAEYVDGS
jgi:hypothetical protein